MWTPDVLWIGGVVCRVTEYTVRELRDPAYHEMVNMIRNRPNSDGFVPIR